MSSRYRKRRPVCDPLLIQLMLALPARILQLDVQVLVVGIAVGKRSAQQDPRYMAATGIGPGDQMGIQTDD